MFNKTQTQILNALFDDQFYRNLFNRYLDEAEYENWDDYVRVITKHFTEHHPKLKQIGPATCGPAGPFVLQFCLHDEPTVLTLHMNKYESRLGIAN